MSSNGIGCRNAPGVPAFVCGRSSRPALVDSTHPSRGNSRRASPRAPAAPRLARSWKLGAGDTEAPGSVVEIRARLEQRGLQAGDHVGVIRPRAEFDAEARLRLGDGEVGIARAEPLPRQPDRGLGQSRPQGCRGFLLSPAHLRLRHAGVTSSTKQAPSSIIADGISNNEPRRAS